MRRQDLSGVGVTQCFYVTPKEPAEQRRFLRRYYRGGTWDAAQQKTIYGSPCPGLFGYHNADVQIENVVGEGLSGDRWPHGDERWPAKCESCEYRFDQEDHWQLNEHPLYVSEQRPGEVFTLRDNTPGMMWNASWMSEHWRGADGLCLVAVLPGGHHWMIDGPASNCTMKDD